MKWMRHHGTLHFSPPHMNSDLVATWEAYKPSSATITHNAFKNTHILHLSPTDIDTNHQACLAGNQKSNRDKADDIGQIVKASIASIEMSGTECGAMGSIIIEGDIVWSHYIHHH